MVGDASDEEAAEESASHVAAMTASRLSMNLIFSKFNLLHRVLNFKFTTCHNCMRLLHKGGELNNSNEQTETTSPIH